MILIHPELKLRLDVAVEAFISFFLALEDLEFTLRRNFSICRPILSTLTVH